MSHMRRSSYASVLSGNTAPASNVTRSGFMSQLAEPGSVHSPLSQSYPSQHPHLHDRRPPHSRSDSHVDLAARRHSSNYGNMGDTHSGNTFEPWPEFFIPSYLKNSRHVERLQERYRARQSSQKDARSGRSSMGSLSRSTSGANLHKMVPSSRGMTHEIIERPYRPSPEEEVLAELPTRLSATTKAQGVEVAYDGSEAKYNGLVKERGTDEGFAVRSDRPMPQEVGVYYYEVTVLSKGRESPIAIGFSADTATLNRMPGWEPESWAYHGDDGHSFCQNASGKQYGAKFGVSDVIGCGINFRTNNAFFTKNGVFLGTSIKGQASMGPLTFGGNAFREIRPNGLYPIIGFKRAQEHVRVNFGQTAFVYDIDNYVKNEQDSIRREIEKEDVSHFHDSRPERLLEQELVAQYLAHEGYIEAAKAFAGEVQRDEQHLRNSTERSSPFEYREDPHAVHRQRIRSAILDGDVDQALVLTNKHYPSVLSGNENIYFKLRCRKFIEMIRKCTELQPSSKSKRGMASKPLSNGHAPAPDMTNGRMDIDHEDGSAVDDDEDEVMQAEPQPDAFAKQTNLVNEALKYGQELQSEFRDDPRREIKQALEDTFALIAYPDARESSLAPLLEPDGRIPVAEELNGAILVSLGKSPNAALEHLYQQTEILISDLSKRRDGDAASLINVRNDYLR